ncbi:hypothetical protein LCGC14_2079760 [marine sediment metagenome]|uniref:Uncharacterized protein n=1 Tax=marine sediment metagenome TaxID=412755 RepID=A0A0F9F3B1_9ZZZZ|nr:hypothetical protein [Desulfobacterales bacterium]
MKRYTEAIHAQRVKKMLEKKEPCKGTCPAKKRYGFSKDFITGHRWDATPPACSICRGFVGHNDDVFCPCPGFGPEEAIRRTWLALEAKGYI